MQLIGQVDPSNVANKSFETGVAARGGKVILHNLSAYDLKLTFGGNPSRTALLMGWQQRLFDFCKVQTDSIEWEIINSSPNQIDSPSTILIGEAYAPGEVVPISYPNYDRLSNVGNQSLPTSSTQAIKNDGSAPNSQIIESTPNDQNASSVDITNDGSALWQVLSAGILKQFLQIIRGSNTQDAVMVLGDPNYPTLLVVHGVCDSASNSGHANTADSAYTTNTLTVYDNGTATTRNVSWYEGITDPSTYLTPNEGDFWAEG